jgi:uncharacterized membrane protein YcjF (UPF0283 family)
VAKNSEDKTVVKPEAKDEDSPTMVCPMCGTAVLEEAIECPSCGEPFSPEAFELKEATENRKSKMLFYSGVILVLVGGPGVAFGSWLHDWLKVPIGTYDNFDSFGWVNRLFATVGIIILVIGIILLILSLPRIKSEKSKKDKELTKPDN